MPVVGKGPEIDKPALILLTVPFCWTVGFVLLLNGARLYASDPCRPVIRGPHQALVHTSRERDHEPT
jgi:hypothetical protein